MGTSNMGIFARETTELEQIEQVETEIREFVRRDAVWQQQSRNDGEAVTDDLSTLLQRVSMQSVQKIDQLIGDLQTLRDRLGHEAERVQREIIEYAGLSQA